MWIFQKNPVVPSSPSCNIFSTLLGTLFLCAVGRIGLFFLDRLSFGIDLCFIDSGAESAKLNLKLLVPSLNKFNAFNNCSSFCNQARYNKRGSGTKIRCYNIGTGKFLDTINNSCITFNLNLPTHTE